MTSLPRYGAAGALALLLSACAAIPPDRNPLPLRDATLAQLPADIHFGATSWPDAHWWTSYADPQLDALIDRALRDHPTLDVARARLTAAGAALDAQQAQAGAQLGVGADLNRQRYSGNGLFPAPIGGAVYTDANLQLRANYDLDWWGKHRALIGAAMGDVKARLAEQAQAQQTLAAALAQSYFRWQALQARLANGQAMSATLRAVVADQAKRVAQGLARSDERRSADLDLAHQDEANAQLTTDAAREREALRALVGGEADALATLAARTAPDQTHALPSRLGLDLLARRPDLQAARYRVEAALGRIDAARAAFYPDINLSASFGLDAVSLGRLLRFDSRTALIGGAIELPLFDSGRLGAQLESVRAQRDAAIADYNDAVLMALRDVAQEGATLQGIDRQLDGQRASIDASAALLRNARVRRQQGLGDAATVLSRELTVLRQQDNRLQLAGAQRQSEIALIKALGGGYQSSAAPTLTSAQQP